MMASDAHVGSGDIEKFEAVFVGSGFGAAVTACRLVGCFTDSILLERGRRFEAQDFPRVKLPEYLTDQPELQTSQRLPDAARLLWGFDQGLFDVRNLGQLRVVQAAGLGGGSLIYANVQLRPPEVVFKDWPSEYQGSKLDPYFDRVMDELNAKPWPEHRRHDVPKAELVRKAASRLSRDKDDPNALKDFFYPPLAIDASKCTGCGNCTIGCQEGAKNTLDKNYIAHAERHPSFKVRTLCEVMQIENCEGDEYHVIYFDHLTRVSRVIRASYVFLGAGAVGTTEILFRSREKKKLSPKGATNGLVHLGKNFYANGDNLGVVFDTDEYVAPSQGPTITTTVLHVEPPKGDKPQPWFLIQDGGVPANLEPVLGYFWSPRWFDRNSLTEARRRDTGWLRSPVELGDRLVADFEALAGDLANALATERRRVSSRRAGFPTEWIEFLPASAKAVGHKLKDSSEMAIAELRRFDTRLLEKLARDTWYLSKLVLDHDRLVDRVADVIAEFYPPLRNVLRKGQGFENLLGVLKFLALGKPPSQRTMVLLAMGPDLAGTLECRERGRLRIRWKNDDAPSAELFALQERLMRDFAVELGGELRTNPEWTFGRKAVTVHAQGGCGMPRNQGDAEAVTNWDGSVRGFKGLYVVDAAAFPSSVGANPSCTIAAVAELKAQEFRRTHKKCKVEELAGAKTELRETRRLSSEPTAAIRSEPVCITWREELRGWIAQLDKPPKVSFSDLLELERRSGLNSASLHLDLQVVLPEFDVFAHAFEHGQPLHAAEFQGTIRSPELNLPDPKVSGSVLFLTRKNAAGKYELRGMTYNFTQSPANTDRLPDLEGTKVFENDPGYDVWEDLTTMMITGTREQPQLTWGGIVRVSTRDFFTVQLPSYEACSRREHEARGSRSAAADADSKRFAPSPIARAWALARFARICYRGMVDEYAR